jgi:hypothetical protein
MRSNDEVGLGAKIDFREARSPSGRRLADAVNVNLSLLGGSDSA